MVNVEIPEDIKLFVKDVYERNKEVFNVYLGGGLIRDLYCDKPIKDVDIFFTPKKINPIIAEVGYVPAKCYVNYNKRLVDLTGTSDMAERGVSQVVGLFNSKLSVKEIQFIVYGKPLSMEEVARDFDLNICQAVWSPATEGFYFSPAFINGHTNKFIECLHEYDKVRMYHRYERMEDKFEDYDVVGKPSIQVLPAVEQKQRKEGTYKRPENVGSFIDE